MDSNKKFKEYMDDQIIEINKHKWIESEKAHIDLGRSAVLDWISKYAPSFRNKWFNKHSE